MTMNQQNYKAFEDERLYQPWGPLHPQNATTDLRKKILADYHPTKYHLKDGMEYWFDGRFNRICTDDSGFYLQTIASSDFGNVQKRLYVSINGRRIQLSRKNNETLISPVSVPPLKKAGKWAWKIEEIGSPLYFHTGFEDDRRKTKRPIDERRQCITNASKFSNRADQDKNLELVKAAFSTFGNIFGVDAAFGREQPGENIVEFSEELSEEIKRGVHVEI
ncbi:MAG: hypothetical protein ABJD83_03785 [Roseobacter sp.]